MRRAASNRRAFTMLETLSVVGVLALAAGILGGSAWHVLSSLQLRNSASEFLQTVQTARQVAVHRRCRTRIAFRAGLWDRARTADRSAEERSYRTFAFVVPGPAGGDAGRWMPVTGDIEEESEKIEWARLEMASRPESMVGRWLVCAADQKTKFVPEALRLTSPLFERFENPEHREFFFRENYHTPETTWTERGVDPHEQANCLAEYPANFWRTPIDGGPLLFTELLPETERCFDPLTREAVPARQFWPGAVTFILGSRTTQTEELPGIEFQPDGSLACRWADQLEFHFAYTSRLQTEYVVAVDVATGRARLLDAEAE